MLTTSWDSVGTESRKMKLFRLTPLTLEKKNNRESDCTKCFQTLPEVCALWCNGYFSLTVRLRQASGLLLPLVQDLLNFKWTSMSSSGCSSVRNDGSSVNSLFCDVSAQLSCLFEFLVLLIILLKGSVHFVH